MSAASDEAIATLSGAGAVLLLAISQYVLSRSGLRNRSRRRTKDDTDEDG